MNVNETNITRVINPLSRFPPSTYAKQDVFKTTFFLSSTTMTPAADFSDSSDDEDEIIVPLPRSDVLQTPKKKRHFGVPQSAPHGQRIWKSPTLKTTRGMVHHYPPLRMDIVRDMSTACAQATLGWGKLLTKANNLYVLVEMRYEVQPVSFWTCQISHTYLISITGWLDTRHHAACRPVDGRTRRHPSRGPKLQPLRREANVSTHQRNLLPGVIESATVSLHGMPASMFLSRMRPGHGPGPRKGRVWHPLCKSDCVPALNTMY